MSFDENFRRKKHNWLVLLREKSRRNVREYHFKKSCYGSSPSSFPNSTDSSPWWEYTSPLLEHRLALSLAFSRVDYHRCYTSQDRKHRYRLKWIHRIWHSDGSLPLSDRSHWCLFVLLDLAAKACGTYLHQRYPHRDYPWKGEHAISLGSAIEKQFTRSDRSSLFSIVHERGQFDWPWFRHIERRFRTASPRMLDISSRCHWDSIRTKAPSGSPSWSHSLYTTLPSMTRRRRDPNVVNRPLLWRPDLYYKQWWVCEFGGHFSRQQQQLDCHRWAADQWSLAMNFPNGSVRRAWQLLER